MNKKEAELWLKSTVSDVFMDFLYYDRKEDEEMNVYKLRDLMDRGVIDKETMKKVLLNK